MRLIVNQLMNQLPPGQLPISSFPRFGLPRFAARIVPADRPLRVEIDGAVQRKALITADVLASLNRFDQVSDFHCVTTWSALNVHWGGYRFADVYKQIIKPLAAPDDTVTHVLFRCLDGARTALPLQDLLADDVLLADSLNGEALGSAHGAPLRLVAPKHYGYKNPKHLKQMELSVEPPAYRPSGFRFMDHPRARVALEERGRRFPGWLLRYAYRPLVGGTIRRFEEATP